MPTIAELMFALSIADRIVKAIKATSAALRSDSPGGKRITKRERKEIVAALVPLVEEIVDEVEEREGL